MENTNIKVKLLAVCPPDAMNVLMCTTRAQAPVKSLEDAEKRRAKLAEGLAALKQPVANGEGLSIYYGHKPQV